MERCHISERPIVRVVNPLLAEPQMRGEEARQAAEWVERNKEIGRTLWRRHRDGHGDEPIEGMVWFHGFRDRRPIEQIKREGIDRRGWTQAKAAEAGRRLVSDLGLPPADPYVWQTDKPGPRNIFVTHRREDVCGWAERTPEIVNSAVWNAVDKSKMPSFERVEFQKKIDKEIKKRFGRPYMAILKLPLTPNQIYSGVALEGPQNADIGRQYIPPEGIIDVKPCLKVRFRGYWGGSTPQYEYLEKWP